jgi:restriction system protein
MASNCTSHEPLRTGWTPFSSIPIPAGGKFVLQAERYTKLVDVAAVRDLFGTVMNEGANRGILITTSSDAPDAYEFAKNKPLSLIDGPKLLLMLQRHGK